MEKIFLSYHFDARIKPLVDQIKRLIKSHNIEIETGEKIPGGQINQSVGDLIRKSDAMIVILSKRAGQANNDWVKHERSLASQHEIPFIALIEDGLQQQDTVFKSYKHILFTDENIADAIIQISETIYEWKILLGEQIVAYLEPSDVAEIIRQNENLPELVRYRFLNRRDGWGEWKDALIVPQAGGVSLVISGVSKESEIQIQVRTQNKTWKSDVVNRNLRISVS